MTCPGIGLIPHLILTLAICIACMLSHVQLFATTRTTACQPPLSMGFSRQEYWSGLPFPPPGPLPNPGIEPTSPAWAGGFFTTEPPGKPSHNFRYFYYLHFYMWGNWIIDTLHYLLKITKQVIGRTGKSPKGVWFQQWRMFLGLGTCSTAQELIIPIVAQRQRIQLPMQETQEPQVWPLGREDPLEKEMQPTPVFLPGKSHGQRSLAGCSPWDCRLGHGLATKQTTRSGALLSHPVTLRDLQYVCKVHQESSSNKNLHYSQVLERTLQSATLGFSSTEEMV